MKTSLLAPFKILLPTPKNNTMEASGSAICIAANSNNRTLNVLEIHETYNINYEGIMASPSTNDNRLLDEGAQIKKGIINGLCDSKKKYQGQDAVLTTTQRTTPGTMDLIAEGEEDNEPTTPTLSTYPTRKQDTAHGHTRNPSRTIRVLDTKELIMGDSASRKGKEDNFSKLTTGTARTSQYSADGKGGRYKLRKLSLGDLRFSQPVEKYIKTYMTSKKQNFSHHSEYAICLWHPFSSLDNDNDMQEKHCILGDVGSFNSRGGFDVMFNMFMTMEENQHMGYSPPATFIPFKSSIKHWSRIPTEESNFFMTYDLEYRDEGRKCFDIYSFQSIRHSERPGSAILVAPGCFARELNPKLISSIRSYLSEQVESWYDPKNYPNRQHENLSIGSLKLIYTCYKSKVWAAAATTHRSVLSKPDLLEAKLFRISNKIEEYEWDVHPSFKANRGSSKPDVPNIAYTVAVEVCPLGLPSSESVLGRVMSSLHSTTKTPFSSIFSFS